MLKSKLPQSPRIYFILFILWAFLLLLMPKNGKFNYDYRKGSPWTYETLVAKFDFPILKTQEQLDAEREKAGSAIIPYFKYSSEIAQKSRVEAENLDLADYPNLKQSILYSLNSIYEKGVISEDGYDASSASIIFVQKGKRASKCPVSDVYTIQNAKTALLADAIDTYPEINVDSLLSADGVYGLIVPNLIYDSETTDLVHAEDENVISPTSGFVNSGQLIVSKGEIVTSEIQQMLDSYKAEYENNIGYNGSRVSLWIGNALLAFILVLILFLSIFYTNPTVFDENNRFIYLIFVFALSSGAALIVENIASDLLYLIPFTLTALYLLAFFKKRVVLPTYVISLIPLLVFSHNGISLFLIFLAAGVVTMYVYRYLNKGWKQFLMALVSFVVMVITYYGFCLINDTSILSDTTNIFYLFGAAVLSVAGYPFVYLFEKLFRLVSNNRLQELCDTNNTLISELAKKAPGTFQHSLQVMNMAEAAANEIGANALLARTGALYHDIGKITNPQCFIENAATGTNYHGNLSYKESARAIISHVTDGVDLAHKHSLPEFVIDFILSHHGTSSTGYFYNKYLNEGGDPNDVSDFFYHGKKPVTKEQTIVMLCDTLEAASRTLKDNETETFNKFVDGIVASKMSEGQLSDSDLTLGELEIVKNKLKSYLAQIHHDRIAYPKRNS